MLLCCLLRAITRAAGPRLGACPLRSGVRAALSLALLAAATTPLPAQMGGMTFSVRVAPAEQREVARSLEFTGTLAPWREIDLSAKVEGLVVESPLEPGMPIKAGQVIVKLDEAAVRAEIRELEAAVRVAQSELNRLEAGNREEDIDEARQRVVQAEAREKSARDDWERQRPLVEEGVISRNEGARVESAWRAAVAEVDAQRAASRRVVSGFRKEEVSTQRATVAVEQARLDDAKRRLREHEIKAPVDCVMVERLREPGEWVAPGDAIAKLVVLDPLKVMIDVPQIHIPRIKMGQAVQIRIDGMPDKRLRAEVAQIVPAAGSGTRNFPVWMKLPNPNLELNSGLFARVLLDVGDPVPTTLVPREAVQIRGETLIVQVAEKMPETPAPAPGAAPGGPPEEGKDGEVAGGGGGPMGGPPPPPPDALVREVEVKTGNEIGEMVAVQIVHGDPIRPGQDVIVMGGTRLVNGMPVRIIRDKTVPGAPAAADATTTGGQQTSAQPAAAGEARP